MMTPRHRPPNSQGHRPRTGPAKPPSQGPTPTTPRPRLPAPRTACRISVMEQSGLAVQPEQTRPPVISAAAQLLSLSHMEHRVLRPQGLRAAGGRGHTGGSGRNGRQAGPVWLSSHNLQELSEGALQRPWPAPRPHGVWVVGECVGLWPPWLPAAPEQVPS